MIDLVIIVPVLIYGYDCDKVGLFFKACSRIVRLKKINLIINLSGDDGEDSNVKHK